MVEKSHQPSSHLFASSIYSIYGAIDIQTDIDSSLRGLVDGRTTARRSCCSLSHDALKFPIPATLFINLRLFLCSTAQTCHLPQIKSTSSSPLFSIQPTSKNYFCTTYSMSYIETRRRSFHVRGVSLLMSYKRVTLLQTID